MPPIRNHEKELLTAYSGAKPEIRKLMIRLGKLNRSNAAVIPLWIYAIVTGLLFLDYQQFHPFFCEIPYLLNLKAAHQLEPLFLNAELLFLCFFIFCTITGFIIWAWPFFVRTPIYLSDLQCKLFNISKDDPRFKIVPVRSESQRSTTKPGVQEVLTWWNKPNLDWIFSIRPRSLSSSVISQGQSSPAQSFMSAPPGTAFGSPAALHSASSLPSPFSYSPSSATPTLDRSIFSSIGSDSASLRSYPTPTFSDISFVGDDQAVWGVSSPYAQPSSRMLISDKRETFTEALTRLRKARSASPYVHERDIDMMKQSVSFNRAGQSPKHDGQELSLKLDTSTYKSNGSQSFWNSLDDTRYGRTSSLVDVAALANRKYQTANLVDTSQSLLYSSTGPSFRTQQSSLLDSSHSSSLTSSIGSNAAVWLKFGINPDCLDIYEERLRGWIARTILRPVVAEIDKINEILTAQGRTDLLIGDVNSMQHLPQFLSSKSDQFQNLGMLLLYLDLNCNSEYLVQRYRLLAKDGCLSDYKWNGGMKFKDRDWDAHLPTDARLIMHVMCTYLDAHLTANPMFPEGKTFSQQFVQSPEKLKEKKRYPVFYQTSVNPPHFQLVRDGETLDVGKGRHNLMHAWLLFLHLHLNDGAIAGVSLGRIGLNIQWIFD